MMRGFLFYWSSFNINDDINIISNVISSFVTIWTMDDSGLSLNIEAVTQRCSVKKMFLEISQNSQENTCARVSFIDKVAGLRR